jgi:hypothetical protein
MSLYHPHWFLNCLGRSDSGHHLIPIPRSIPTETRTSLQQTSTDVPLINVVCNTCGLVYGYSQLQKTGRPSDEADPFLIGDFRLAATKVQCDSENCGALKTVHAILENDKGIWKPRIDPESWQFDDSARCHTAEHKLRLEKGRKLLWEARASLSF